MKRRRSFSVRSLARPRDIIIRSFAPRLAIATTGFALGRAALYFMSLRVSRFNANIFATVMPREWNNRFDGSEPAKNGRNLLKARLFPIYLECIAILKHVVIIGCW